ncbi:sensor histidine kinase [Solirubrobacter soli]|uniref:sensor histidine kinase n=1 Tax=Solirubrobacter soli TaxID=363832 RepID=UPI000488840E|nr:HAMP domain-containing sensor histidine kinase [Solirubrobacter soli]
MIRTALRGLRGRLLLSLVATSAITLAVAAAITLGPLQSRLRDESQTALQQATQETRYDFANALEKTAKPKKDENEVGRQSRRAAALGDVARDLRDRTNGARVMVTDLTFTDPSGENAPAFLYDTDFQSIASGNALRLAIRASVEGVEERQIVDDELTFAMPLFKGNEVDGVVVAQRNLTEVSTTVRLVRNALLTAAAIGLVVAIGLALGLSSTLTRRLGRLQRAALRITQDGPEAPAPVDRGRDEVGDLARALARMQEELRRQEAARRSFVATASHELRTPLTTLQGTMELLDEDLQEGGDLTDAQEQVASARGELRRLSVLASELLDLSRLDAAIQLRNEPVELGEIARAVAAEFSLRAADRGVDLLVDSPGPCWAHADPAACVRVVRILIDNALRYAPRGKPISITATYAGSRVSVRVSDRGPGVPVEEREHVFERFHRGKATSTETGFGLGLAIGRELAERMNGTLELSDSYERGACFVLTLPASASSPAPSPAPDSAAAA